MACILSRNAMLKRQFIIQSDIYLDFIKYFKLEIVEEYNINCWIKFYHKRKKKKYLFVTFNDRIEKIENLIYIIIYYIFLNLS